MPARELAELSVRKGSEGWRVEVMRKMKNEKYSIPSIVDKAIEEYDNVKHNDRQITELTEIDCILIKQCILA